MPVSVETRPAPAKATTVSIEARPAPAKAMPVSTPHRHNHAKATPVSDNRPSWPTGPGCGARGRRRGQAGLRADAPSHTSVHQAPPVWRAPEGPKGAGGICRGAGGRWRGLAGLRDDAPSEARSADGERAGRRCGGRKRARLRRPRAMVGPGRGAGGWRPGQGATHSYKPRPIGGRRVACGAWPRCRWVAAGPGRASRSTTPSRRLACGDLAGGPPPTGTHSGPADSGRPRGGRRSGGPPPMGAQSSHTETLPPQQAAPRAAAAQ